MKYISGKRHTTRRSHDPRRSRTYRQRAPQSAHIRSDEDDEYEDEIYEEDTLYDPHIPTVWGSDDNEIVIDTGIIDEFGEAIYRIEYREPIGFRYWEQLPQTE
jgi:hypothetical protein